MGIVLPGSRVVNLERQGERDGCLLFELSVVAARRHSLSFLQHERELLLTSSLQHADSFSGALHGIG